jgi:hypothetical protein
MNTTFTLSPKTWFSVGFVACSVALFAFFTDKFLLAILALCTAGIAAFVAAWLSSLSLGRMRRLLIYNTAVLLFYYGIWFGGWYMSEYWMHIIDTGAPWSWIILLCGSSFIGSLLILRKPGFEAILKSLACAFGILVASVMLWFFSMPFFDAYF